MDRGRVSPASEAVLPLSPEQQQQDHSECSEERWVDRNIHVSWLQTQSHQFFYSSNAEVSKIKSNASMTEILEAMKLPQSGIGFLTQHPSLPSLTFVSAEAVQWLNNHVESGVTVEKATLIMQVVFSDGISTATITYDAYFQGMIREKLVCHASGDFNKPFILGFYLYHIVQEKDVTKTEKDPFPPLGDLQSFENEWVEVEMKPPKGWCEPTAPTANPTISSPISIPSCDTIDESSVPVFLRDDIDLTFVMDDREWTGKIWHDLNIDCDYRTAFPFYPPAAPVPPYKHTHLDIDINNRSDRIEWGHLRYQSLLKTDHSYELVVQWVASSGSIAADLVSSIKSIRSKC